MHFIETHWQWIVVGLTLLLCTCLSVRYIARLLTTPPRNPACASCTTPCALKQVRERQSDAQTGPPCPENAKKQQKKCGE